MALFAQLTKDESPFPRRLCSSCVDDFDCWRVFLTRINRGQMILAKLLFERERVDIPMPDMLERPLFAVKYPSTPKKPVSSNGPPPPPKPPRGVKKQQQQPLAVVEEAAAAAPAGKRVRRAPKRLVEESYSGPDLEKRLKREIRSREAAAARHSFNHEYEEVVLSSEPVIQPPTLPSPSIASPLHPPPPPPPMQLPPTLPSCLPKADNLFAELDLMFPLNPSDEQSQGTQQV